MTQYTYILYIHTCIHPHPLTPSQEALETLHEAVKELEAQPQTNLAHSEMEDYYSLLMVQ